MIRIVGYFHDCDYDDNKSEQFNKEIVLDLMKKLNSIGLDVWKIEVQGIDVLSLTDYDDIDNNWDLINQKDEMIRMSEEHELIQELLYKNSPKARKEIDRQLKEYKLIKNKLVIIFQNLAALEGIVFREE